MRQFNLMRQIYVVIKLNIALYFIHIKMYVESVFMISNGIKINMSNLGQTLDSTSLLVINISQSNIESVDCTQRKVN